MAKKKEEVKIVETVEVQAVINEEPKKKVNRLELDFGRADLNQL